MTLIITTRRQLIRLATFLDFAENLGRLSTCKRARCGALITDPRFSAVYAIGYNGPARGEINDACTGETGKCGCIHAEANAIAKLRYPGSAPLTLLSTTAPCHSCAGLIINCGAIDHVVCVKPYRDGRGTYRLTQAGIICNKCSDFVEQAMDSQ